MLGRSYLNAFAIWKLDCSGVRCAGAAAILCRKLGLIIHREAGTEELRVAEGMSVMFWLTCSSCASMVFKKKVRHQLAEKKNLTRI